MIVALVGLHHDGRRIKEKVSTLNLNLVALEVLAL